jgi:hypothetical protein
MINFSSLNRSSILSTSLIRSTELITYLSVVMRRMNRTNATSANPTSENSMSLNLSEKYRQELIRLNLLSSDL